MCCVYLVSEANETSRKGTDNLFIFLRPTTFKFPPLSGLLHITSNIEQTSGEKREDKYKGRGVAAPRQEQTDSWDGWREREGERQRVFCQD